MRARSSAAARFDPQVGELATMLYANRADASAHGSVEAQQASYIAISERGVHPYARGCTPHPPPPTPPPPMHNSTPSHPTQIRQSVVGGANSKSSRPRGQAYTRLLRGDRAGGSRRRRSAMADQHRAAQSDKAERPRDSTEEVVTWPQTFRERGQAPHTRDARGTL